MRKLRNLLALTAAVTVAALAAAPAYAGNGGNSAAAKACQENGWQQWRRADQTSFSNSGDCASYAAHGGTLTAPLSDGGSGSGNV